MYIYIWGRVYLIGCAIKRKENTRYVETNIGKEILLAGNRRTIISMAEERKILDIIRRKWLLKRSWDNRYHWILQDSSHKEEILGHMTLENFIIHIKLFKIEAKFI